jgi:hypothetical protein
MNGYVELMIYYYYDSTALRWASVRASEDSSCLRPRGHCDRLASERAKTVHADRAATVTGLRPCQRRQFMP